MKSKKNQILVRIRKIEGNQTTIFDDVGKEFIGKDNKKYLKLIKTKQTFLYPPPDSIDINSKGYSLVELYLDVDNKKYKYLKDGNQIEFKNPIDTSMCSFLAEQVIKANSREDPFAKNRIMNIILLVWLGIILISGLLFGSNPYEALEVFSEQNYTNTLNKGKMHSKSIVEYLDILNSTNQNKSEKYYGGGIKW